MPNFSFRGIASRAPRSHAPGGMQQKVPSRDYLGNTMNILASQKVLKCQ